jgi:stearoyl-CoA desaturase (delta-9 desaturase)
MFEWTSSKAAVFQGIGTLSIPFGIYFFDLSWLLASLMVFWLLALMSTVALHRLFVHATYKCSRFWHWTLGTLSCLTMTSSPLQWAVAHYTHHKHSDTPEDPHNNSLAKIFGLAYFTKSSYDFTRARRLLRDPMHVTLHKYYLLVHAAWVVAWGAVAGLDGVYFGWLLPVTIWMWAGAVHTRFSHRDGHPVNMHWLFGFVFLGEHLHKLHHKEPHHANNATEPGQLDVGYFFIRLIRNAS